MGSGFKVATARDSERRRLLFESFFFRTAAHDNKLRGGKFAVRPREAIDQSPETFLGTESADDADHHFFVKELGSLRAGRMVDICIDAVAADKYAVGRD